MGWEEKWERGYDLERRRDRIILYSDRIYIFLRDRYRLFFFFFRFYKVFNGILIFLEFGILEIVEIEAITWAKISLVDWGIYYTAD